MAKIISVDSKHEENSRKQNIFRLIWEWFLSLDKLSRLSIATIILIAIATPSIVSTYLVFNPRAAVAPSVGTSYSSAPSSTSPLAPKSLVSGSGSAGAQSYTVDSEIVSLLTLLNYYRVLNGLPALTPSLILTEVAKWMSNDMASNNYFGHTDSLGRDPYRRMNDFGYTYNTWKGENLAAGYQTASAVLEGWKASVEHNKLLLKPEFTAVGLYRAYNSNSSFGWYWAQEFGGTIDTPVAYVTPALNTLNVKSSPVAGAVITDAFGRGLNGTTNYTKTSSSTMNTRLDAPSSFITGGIKYNFSSASGCRNSGGADNTDRFCDVYVVGGETQTVTFTYSASTPSTNTLNVKSSPVAGAVITDAFGRGLNGTTNYTKTSSSTMNTRLDAPSSFITGGIKYNFSSASGCRNSGGADNTDRFCDVYVVGGETQTVTFTYSASTPSTNTLNVKSSPVAGAVITDAYSKGFGGTTYYFKTSSSTISTRIDAPSSFTSAGVTYKFSSASGCRNSSGADNADRFCDVYVTGGGSQNVAFYYTR